MKSSANDVLKTADTLIRRGQLEEAEACVTRAQQIDPKNIYSYAFKERIASLKEEALRKSLHQQKEMQDRNNKVGETAPPFSLQSQEDTVNSQEQKNLHPISQDDLLAAARSFVQPEFVTTKDLLSEKPTILDTNMLPFSSLPSSTLSTFAGSSLDVRDEKEESREAKIQQLVRNAIEAARNRTEANKAITKDRTLTSQSKVEDLEQSSLRIGEGEEAEIRKVLEGDLQERIREALRRKKGSSPMERSKATIVENLPKVSEPSSQELKTPAMDAIIDADRKATLGRYKLVLESVWTDGAASLEEIETLEQLRLLLSITPEEHERLQKEVQMDTYVEAFKKAWNAGKISKKDVAVLAELRERFHISMEEHLAIESRILWEIQPEQEKPTLMVVDDDEKLLQVVTNTLNNAGFFTTPFTTSDEALSYLKSSSPDLILCDVNLRTSSMGGFAFYEKVRELDQLRDIPFIFLSGLSDEALVKAGKELGADDYLSKPVSEEILLATIRGKLRRYHELKERAN